jgi:hypothetical protein
MNYDAPMRRWKGHMRNRLVLVGVVLAGCGTKSESRPPPTPAPAPVAIPVSADAAPAVDSAALYKAVGERVIKEIDAAYPPMALAPNASTDPHIADIPAVGDCARPDATERAAIEKLLAEAYLIHVGCKDPDGIIVAEQFDRMKGTRRDKGVWRVLRVKDKKVTQLGEAVGTPEVDWQEWAEENTINVLVLADVDGDGARDAVLEQTSQEGGAVAHTSVLQVVKSTATKAVKLGDFDAVTEVRLALGSRPGALVLGVFPHFDDKKPVYKCVTLTALTDCPAAAQAASGEAKREVAQTFASGTLKPRDRTQLAGYLDTLGVQGDERERLLATVPEAKAP